MLSTNKKKRSSRVRYRAKKNANGTLRLSFYKSSKNLYAQIIDDKKNETLVSASSFEKEMKKINKVNKKELSVLIAERLAKKAQEKKISKVFFDRGNYKYHGRIKTFAETLRKNGMEF